MTKRPVSPEWTVKDNETLRAAIDGMRKHRKLSMEDLVRKIGGRMVNAFITGRSANLRCDSLFKVTNALGYEIRIVPLPGNRTERRIQAMREEKGLPSIEQQARVSADAVVLAEEIRTEVAALLQG